jgi:glycosyltransferase involved in cell wall biosynthesis
VPNPVDIKRFAAPVSKGFLRQKLGLGQNMHLAGMVGRLHPVKGYDLAIKALAQIGEDVHLALVGPDEGGYLAHIRQLAQLYNVQTRLHWLGQLEGEELVAAYADMDSFLLPSQSENFGNVVVEAMAAGLPVLISNRVGVAAEVAQARAGLVYPLKVEALVEALREITTQPGRGREMGQRGRALAKGQYAPETVAQTMLEFYRQLLGKELTGARI